jgi:uncharacterized membrane protein (Fun14 family)
LSISGATSPAANSSVEQLKVTLEEDESKWQLIVLLQQTSPLLTSIGFSGLTGFLIGFAIKKVLKVLAVGAGIFFAVLMYLESQNIVNINWDKLQNASQNAVSTLTNAIGQFPTTSSSTNFALPMTGTGAIGFTIGFVRA